MPRIFIICFLFLSCWQIDLKAQDPVFSQFYAAPLQLNPAFAGNTYAPFVTLNYRSQWSGFADFGTYNTYAASFSQFVEGLNSGIGLMVQADDAGNGIYQTTRVSGFYSYKIAISKDLSLKFGIEGTLAQSRLDWNQLVFGDQIDVTGAVDATSAEQQPDLLNINYGDISTGLLIYNPYFYGGLAIKHINRPDESILGINGNTSSGLPVRLTIHGGTQIDAYLGFGSFFAGGWFRYSSSNPDAAIGLVGFQKDAFKFGYSYDFTVSGLIGNSGGTHEFSMVLNFDNFDEIILFPVFSKKSLLSDW